MVIGFVEAGLALALVLVLVVVLVLELLHAATRLTDSTAAALRAKAFLESQGSWGLTPGSSFLLVPVIFGLTPGQVSLVPSPSGTSACSLTSVRPPRPRPLSRRGGQLAVARAH